MTVPRGACDCHAHIFGPQDRYGYQPERRYTPPDASLADYLALLDRLGIERGILVQPSIYGTDNSAMLAAMQAGRHRLRAVAVVDPSISDNELGWMNSRGVRGARLNLRFEEIASEEHVSALARRILSFGWHLQLYARGNDIRRLERVLMSLPVDIVIDHMGEPPVADGVIGEAFQSLLRLLRNGRCWVKLSGPMRMSAEQFPYADMLPFVRELAETRPDRLIWGSDWPHPNLVTRMPNDGDLLDLLGIWIPDEAMRDRILVDNPAELYRF